MKIRSDFVTNSSSSSFIIASNDQTTLEKLETILFDYIINSPEELEEYFSELILITEASDSTCNNLYKESKKYLDQGYTVLSTIRTSYHDDSYDLITEYIKNTDAFVINDYEI